MWEIGDSSDSIFTCCQGDISARILRAVLYPPAKVLFGPSQECNTDIFARTVKLFKLTLLTIFVKSSFVDV